MAMSKEAVPVPAPVGTVDIAMDSVATGTGAAGSSATEARGAGIAETAAPRADLRDALAWFAFGAAILTGSVRMDRLEQQHINPVTVPGLLPGLLGVGMVVLGAVLGLRSWQRGAMRLALAAPSALDREQRKRVWLAIALCVGYGVVLIGHGLPFWLASTIYLTTAILVFRRINPDAAERRFTPRSLLQAALIGAIASVVTWLVFERLFLVRLP